MSVSPMFGVITVNRISRRRPGVTSPSITLQKVDDRFSSRTTHWCESTSARTIRSGPVNFPAGAARGDVTAITPKAIENSQRSAVRFGSGTVHLQIRVADESADYTGWATPLTRRGTYKLCSVTTDRAPAEAGSHVAQCDGFTQRRDRI